ncbi:MAG: hypothetical protein EOM23_12425, partial [Candidatus Moranbacteria bacterium]|nr:hypothetical protein [Candidatus Moranbacteria bacterium]
MDMWFLDNEDRVFKERTAISELNDAVDWLEGLLWKIHEGQLHLEAIIVVDGHEYQILLSYPFLFPETPAWIKPKNPKKGHWSGHQYGNGGTLCLEWGPDNWHPEITGAQLIESAYKLLASEKPHAKNDGKDVLSRHSLTMGQELRSEKYRFFVSSNLTVYLYDQKKLSFGKIHSFFSFRGEQLKFYLQKLEPNDADIWIDDSIPLAVKDDVCEGNTCEGLFFKVDCSSYEIEKLSTLGDLNKLLNNFGFGNVLLDDGEENKFVGRVKTVLLIGKDLK